MIKLSNKWRVSARITPDMNRSLTDLMDSIKEEENFKIRNRIPRREHLVQLLLLEALKTDKEKLVKRLKKLVPELESTCE